MARQLWILRHAKSAWDTPAATDFERPLNARGNADAPRMGRWMAARGLVPAHVISSTAMRARTTTRLVCAELGLDERAIDWQDPAYAAPSTVLLRLLSEAPPAAASVLLVGHNPGLEELLRHLLDRDLPTTADGKLLPTTALARIELPDDWSSLARGCGRLLELQRVKSLPQKGR